MTDFYFSYCGNKRNEIKEFIDIIDFDKYDTIVECFGGSLAFSRYCFNIHPSKKYLISDIDEELTEFCNNIYKNKSEIANAVREKSLNITTKEEYFNYLKENTNTQNEFLIKYLYIRKCVKIRIGLYHENKCKIKLFKFEERTKNTDEFFNNNVYENTDFKTQLEKVKNDKRTLVFLDPPYMKTDRRMYTSKSDIEDIFNYIVKFCETCQCKFIMILAHNSYIEDIFKPYIKSSYIKKYNLNTIKKVENGVVSYSPKIVKHLIITNINDNTE